MRHFILTCLVALSLLGGAAFAEIPKSVDFAKVTMHLKQHQKYPATRAQLIAACHDLKDFSEQEKAWFTTALPEGTYKSADEVVAALKAAK